MSDLFDEVRLAASVFEGSPEAIMITDAEGRILRTNRAFSEITGYSPEEARGRNPRFLQSGRHGSEFYASMWRALELTGSWRGEIWNRRRSGETYPEWLSITSVKDADGRVVQYVATFSDLTERKRIEEDRARLAHRDPLTGVANRSFFEESLRLAVAHALETNRPLVLVLLDLDRFARMNAALGYPGGDVVLSAVARSLEQRVGDRGVVGRFYGDQFAILLPLPEDPDGDRTGPAASALVDDVRVALAPAISAEGQSVRVQASFGVALCPRDARDAAALVFAAETALARAKDMGPGAFCFHTPGLDAEVREQLRLEEEVRAAIETGTIDVHYQPLVDVDTGRVNGAEALLRWRSPRTGDVPPGVVVSAAERGGLAAELGRVVLARASGDLARWRQDGIALERVAVNVSGRQVLDEAFLASMRKALADCALSGRDLELEITESELADPGGSILGVLNWIRQLGVRVSVDDFGTGFSALSHLKRLPVDCLKIDRSFVSGLPDDRNDAAITRTILALAANLGLGTVAEGVETLAQARFLALHGCRELQGNLYGGAVPAADFPAVFRRLGG